MTATFLSLIRFKWKVSSLLSRFGNLHLWQIIQRDLWTSHLQHSEVTMACRYQAQRSPSNEPKALKPDAGFHRSLHRWRETTSLKWRRKKKTSDLKVPPFSEMQLLRFMANVSRVLHYNRLSAPPCFFSHLQVISLY